MRSPLLMLLLAGGVLGSGAAPAAAQDLEPEKQVFAACSACHPADGSNGTGPALGGVIGRRSGTAPGFRYSRAMKGANIIWDEKTLDDYIAAPQRVVPGNLMAFSGLADPRDRSAIIDALKRWSAR
jgi:cytochrome c